QILFYGMTQVQSPPSPPRLRRLIEDSRTRPFLLRRGGRLTDSPRQTHQVNLRLHSAWPFSVVCSLSLSLRPCYAPSSQPFLSACSKISKPQQEMLGRCLTKLTETLFLLRTKF